MVNATDVFQEHERLLFGIAYRMLGSISDAEDIVQDAFLRWQEGSAERAESPRAYLSTVVTRLCIDELRSARVRREQYVGPWLPEPLVTEGDWDVGDDLALADSVSMAFLVVLERLSPTERAAFLLREVFGYDYGELSEMLGKSEPACRQLTHRARERVKSERPRFSASSQEVEAMTRRFLAAAQQGDMAGLMALLADDITAWSDGGGRVIAAQKPVRGREKVARFVVNIVSKAPPGFRATLASVNGKPGVVAYVDGRPLTVGSLEVVEGKIRAIWFVVNPEKLRSVPPLVVGDAG